VNKLVGKIKELKKVIAALTELTLELSTLITVIKMVIDSIF